MSNSRRTQLTTKCKEVRHVSKKRCGARAPSTMEEGNLKIVIRFIYFVQIALLLVSRFVCFVF
jgi:hypothetical protein